MGLLCSAALGLCLPVGLSQHVLAQEKGKAAAKPAPVPVMKQEESLNAFKFVVIPILKRVIPVAAVGAAIAVLIRKLTSKKKS